MYHNVYPYVMPPLSSPEQSTNLNDGEAGLGFDKSSQYLQPPQDAKASLNGTPNQSSHQSERSSLNPSPVHSQQLNMIEGGGFVQDSAYQQNGFRKDDMLQNEKIQATNNYVDHSMQMAQNAGSLNTIYPNVSDRKEFAHQLSNQPQNNFLADVSNQAYLQKTNFSAVQQTQHQNIPGTNVHSNSQFSSHNNQFQQNFRHPQINNNAAFQSPRYTFPSSFPANSPVRAVAPTQINPSSNLTFPPQNNFQSVQPSTDLSQQHIPLPSINTSQNHIHSSQNYSHTPQNYTQLPQNNTQSSQNYCQSQQNYTQNYIQPSVQAGMAQLSLGSNTPKPIDLLQCRKILPDNGYKPPIPKLEDHYRDVNCKPSLLRCTLNAMPKKQELLNQIKLPLGLLVHPFKDLPNLTVIQSSVIVRCKTCRTYINPFVTFVDRKRWKCNLCLRVNEVPDDFLIDLSTRQYGDPTNRPEIQNSTVEFIAPQEYTMRPPQPAIYVFLFDVSQNAIHSGYLSIACQALVEELGNLPGDSRTKLAFIAYDSYIHFLSLPDDSSKPHMLTITDINDVFVPLHDNILINLSEDTQKITELLNCLPELFNGTEDTDSCLGAALQAAHKCLVNSGGRITVFQTVLPSIGPGKLTSREDPNERASKDVKNLKPANDFYQRLALECNGQHIAIDLFMLNKQYADIATISPAARYSSGSINSYYGFSATNASLVEKFEFDFRRYLVRKIGFEAVMRVRCTKGICVSDFHGNGFVRSTDLLALPNVNPDAGFAMKLTVEETLDVYPNAIFQAALLYTTSKGERRIRVHTLMLPVTGSVHELVSSADVMAVVGFLGCMAVDRSISASLNDAREALINAVSDCLVAYRDKQTRSSSFNSIYVPPSLTLFPLYILALLKCIAFRSRISTKLDERVAALLSIKSRPLAYTFAMIYPGLYSLTDLLPAEQAYPRPLHLSAAYLSLNGAFLLDKGDEMILLVRKAIPISWCLNVLDVASFNNIPQTGMIGLPVLENEQSSKLRGFIEHLLSNRVHHAPLLIIRDDSPQKNLFFDSLLEDRTESTSSYPEFLQYIQKIMNN